MSHLTLVSSLEDFDRAASSHQCTSAECAEFRRAANDLRRSLDALGGIARLAKAFDSVAEHADRPST